MGAKQICVNRQATWFYGSPRGLGCLCDHWNIMITLSTQILPVFFVIWPVPEKKSSKRVVDSVWNIFNVSTSVHNTIMRGLTDNETGGVESVHDLSWQVRTALALTNVIFCRWIFILSFKISYTKQAHRSKDRLSLFLYCYLSDSKGNISSEMMWLPSHKWTITEWLVKVIWWNLGYSRK